MTISLYLFQGGVVFKNITLSLQKINRISKWYIPIVIMSSVLTSSLGIMMTYIIKLVIDSLDMGDMNLFIKTIVIMFLANVFVIIINSFARTIILPVISQKINYNIRKEIFNRHIDNSIDEILDDGYFDNYYYVLENTVSSVVGMVDLCGLVFTNIFSIIGISAIFISVGAYISFIIAFASIISFFISLKLQRINYNKNIESLPQRRKVDYVDRIFYQPEYSKDIRTGLKERLFSIFKNAIDELCEIQVKRGRKIVALSSLSSLVITIFTIIVMYKVGVGTINGTYEIGSFALIYSGVNKISTDINSLFSVFPQMYSLNLNINRYNNFMMTYECKSKEENYAYINEIEIRNLSFFYRDKMIFNEFNLTLNLSNNGLFLIKGRNGSGKSTLLNIISGLFKVDNDTVFINGIDINNLSKQFFDNNFSIMFQDYKIYSMTILENITLKSKDELTNNEISRVQNIITDLNLYDKINNLKNKLDTVLSNEFFNSNISFSQGELQKIAIARAIFKDSKIILMDEPTSSLDAQSKTEFYRMINNISFQKPIFIITHDDVNENNNIIKI